MPSRAGDVVVLAAPVGVIVELGADAGTGFGSVDVDYRRGQHKDGGDESGSGGFGKNAGRRFLAGHPMAGKETAGIEGADARLFEDAAWFLTPFPGQNILSGSAGSGCSGLRRWARKWHQWRRSSMTAVRVDFSFAADDLDWAGGGAGGGVWG